MERFWIILSMTTGFYTKKIVLDEIFTIFHKIIHISFNIGPRILNVHTLGHPFPSAGHICFRKFGKIGNFWGFKFVFS